MPAPSPANVAGPLTDRLNALRVRRGNTTGVELDQVRFTAQGLRKADRAAFYAVSGMIAAIEQKPEDLRNVSADLEREFPRRVHCQLNVLRSFMALRLQDEARELAWRIFDRVSDSEEAAILAGCMLHVGAVESARDMAAQFVKKYGHLDLDSAADLHETLEMAEGLLAAGFGDADLGAFLNRTRDAFAKHGWETPTIHLNSPCAEAVEGPLVIARVEVAPDAEEDTLLDVEDAVMDELISARDVVFSSAAVVLAVMPHSSIE